MISNRFRMLFMLALLSGCSAPVIKVTRQDSNFGGNGISQNSASSPKYVAVLTETSASEAGNALTITPEFRESIAHELRASGIFTSVLTDSTSANLPNVVKINFHLDQSYDNNVALGGIKGFVIGASLGLLAPVIPLYATLTEGMQIRAIKPDSSFKDYSSSIKGEIKFHFWDAETFRQDVGGPTTQAALVALREKLENDRAWLQQ